MQRTQDYKVALIPIHTQESSSEALSLSHFAIHSSSSASFLLGVKARVHARQFPVRKQTT